MDFVAKLGSEIAMSVESVRVNNLNLLLRLCPLYIDRLPQHLQTSHTCIDYGGNI